METLAKNLGVEENFLWHVFTLSRNGKGYTSFQIPKRKGGYRTIHKPVPNLFYIQRMIKERILDKAPISSDYATAFCEGKSIHTHANLHCGKSVLVKFDLKDFFPSISFTRVKRIFEQLGFWESDAKGLAYLSTIRVENQTTSPATLLHYKTLRLDELRGSYAKSLRIEARDKISLYEGDADLGVSLKWEADYLFQRAREVANDHPKDLKRRGLPQGAPTSPQLSNLAAMRLDGRLSGLAKSLGFSYSRYADDLTFSSDNPLCKANVLRNLVEQIVTDCKFELNPKKTAFMRAPATRMTVGLVVDGETPRVRRRIIRKVRAMIHQHNLDKLDAHQVEQLQGYLSFIRMVNPSQSEKLEARLRTS